MGKIKKPKLSGWQRFVSFFKETFRPRERNDYREFFTRGLHGRESGTKVEYGWMYVRVFVLSFALFSLITLLIAIAENGIAVPTLYLLGGVFMNLTVAVFIYELNPERNLSFVLFILILIVGTAAADFIAIFGYYLLYPQDAWLSTLWTAVLEEVAKAIPAIVAVLLFKKRSPMLGFIIGAAIGAGFSITEDMGYIYAYSYGVYGMVEIAIERAWTAVCTHTLWTAVIGWAFCKFKCRPYDLRFLLVVISSIALHFLWDMPVGPLFQFLSTAFCIIAAIVFSVVVVKKERKPYKELAAKNEVQLVIPIPEDKARAKLKYGKWFSQTASFILGVTVFLTSVLFMVWCFAPVGYTVVDKRFKSEEQFLDFVQGDKKFIANWDRTFDFDTPDSQIKNSLKIGGEYVYASVTFNEYGYSYDYMFRFYKDEDTGENVGYVTSISVTVSPDEWYWLARVEVPVAVTAEGITYRYVNYAEVNASGCYYDNDTDEYVVVLDSYQDHTAEIVVSASTAGVLLGGMVAFTAFKIKSKMLRRKENVG